MTPEQFLQRTLTDIKVKLEDEFKQNFTRKAFFDEKWKTPKFPNSRGSMMLRSDNLRASILGKVQGNSIVFSSSMPYADIHNNGGEITITPQMKKYFWAMYIKAGKKGIVAEQFKALALKKVGDTIKIEKRQFIGHHENVDKAVKEIISPFLNKNINKLDTLSQLLNVSQFKKIEMGSP